MTEPYQLCTENIVFIRMLRYMCVNLGSVFVMILTLESSAFLLAHPFTRWISVDREHLPVLRHC